MADNDFPVADDTTVGDDAEIASRLHDVPVPVNLNERIKARLRMADLVEPCLADAGLDSTHSSLSLSPSESLGAGPQHLSPAPDRWRPALLLMILAACLVGVAWLANQWRQPNEREWLVKQCHSVLERWEQDSPANLATTGHLADVPVAVREQLARVTLRGTRSLAELTSRFQGTLYRLDAADGQSLVLVRLVDLPAVRGLNSRFSILSTPSGGWSLAALQLNNETYVLAANCTDQQLMNYVRRPIVT